MHKGESGQSTVVMGVWFEDWQVQLRDLELHIYPEAGISTVAGILPASKR